MSRQFQKLEETLNLPPLDNTSADDLTPSGEDIAVAMAKAQELEDQFKKINHYDQHDVEMDELAEMAITAHKDLQKLGMNVEIKYSGEIFSSSSQMLKIAVDAKNNKIEKKLKLLKLQLEKMRIDKLNEDSTPPLEGTAETYDRNEILKHLKQIAAEDK